MSSAFRMVRRELTSTGRMRKINRCSREAERRRHDDRTLLENATLQQVGRTASDFELPDSTGAMRRLSELTASGPLVLLFYPGHW